MLRVRLVQRQISKSKVVIRSRNCMFILHLKHFLLPALEWIMKGKAGSADLRALQSAQC